MLNTIVRQVIDIRAGAVMDNIWVLEYAAGYNKR